MTVPFYDNDPDEGESGVIKIDRIYCFDFARFGDVEWRALDQIYRNLPRFVGYDSVPWWFSAKEAAEPYLYASVEPPGLQVAGFLALRDWRDWDDRFRTATTGLPFYEFE